MEVTFEKIHKTVIETLCPQMSKGIIFETIGNWYYRFLCSDQELLSLKLPYYDRKSIPEVYQYLRIFLLTYKLIKIGKLNVFDNTCLFDLFGYRQNFPRGGSNDYSLAFIKDKGDWLLWEKDVMVSKKIFLPVFKKKQFQIADWSSMDNTFKLFKSIRDNKLIEFPILIDLEKDLALSISCGNELNQENYILFETLVYKKIDDDYDIELEDALREKNISHQISFTYPYNRNIRSWFLDIAPKRFELNVYGRFFYSVISDHDLVLLPRETTLNKEIDNYWHSKINIINTNHGLALYKLMHALKNKWQSYEFNKFTTPFPKYWFLFVNPSLTKEEWLIQFKLSYPSVFETSIIHDIEQIIIELLISNWLEPFLQSIERPIFLIPRMSGLKEKRLKTIFTSFKNFLLEKRHDIKFVETKEDYDYHKYKDLIILEMFNVVELVNIFQNNLADNYKMIVPDFIYFGYQPWIKYQLASYQFEALLSSKRKLLDVKYFNHFTIWQKLRVEIIEETRTQVKNYKLKYKLNNTDVEPIEDIPEGEDMELSNYEEGDLVKIKRLIPYQRELNIVCSSGYNLKLSQNSEVLIQRNTIIAGKAGDLEKGDYFISLNELNSSINDDKLIDKLSDIPNSVRRFQVDLSRFGDVYQTLARRGLEYSSEAYFNNKYIISQDRFNDSLFVIPRKRKNWELICELLKIDNNEISLSWIAHYGRKYLNEVKNIYRHILNRFLMNNYWGQTDNPSVIEETISYIRTKQGVFEDEEDFDPEEIAKTIISSITRLLEFHQVKEVNIVNP